MNLYVDNLSPKVEEEELRRLFEEYGKVVSVEITRKSHIGKPSGYGIVEMPFSMEAMDAVEGLNGRKLRGKRLKVGEPFHYLWKARKGGK